MKVALWIPGIATQFAATLLRAVSTFGTLAALTSAAAMVLFGDSVSSDNPYILGVSAAAIAGGVLLIALIVEQHAGKIAARWVYGASYGLPLFCLALATATASGEAQEGWGLLLLTFAAAVVAAPLEIFLLRRLPLLPFGFIGCALAVATVTMLCLTPLPPH